MRRATRIACALALGSAAVSGACTRGDDNGEMNLEDYLHEFDRILQREAIGIDQAADDVDQVPDTASPDEFRTGLDRLLGEFDDVMTVARDNLATLDPPDEVADEHRTIAEAYGEVHQALRSGRQAIQAATTREEMIELMEEFTVRGAAYQASLRIDEACRELRRLADENDIDLNLECVYPD